MMRTKLLSMGLLLTSLVWLAGCYPSTSKLTEDLDVVVTRYDEDADFQQYKTFHVADTIIQLGDPDDRDFNDLGLTRAEMDVILDKIRSEMRMMNYTEIVTPGLGNVPDVGIFTDVIATTVTVVYTYPPGWGWGWYGGWGGGWPGGGWWYPPTVGGYSYPVGTILLNYVDMEKTIIENNQDLIYTPWVGIANGLLYETSSGAARVPNAIEQMFTQSPYLRQN